MLLHTTVPAHNSLKRGWENSLKLNWACVVLSLLLLFEVLLLLLIATLVQQQQQQHNVLSKRCHLLLPQTLGVVGVCRRDATCRPTAANTVCVAFSVLLGTRTRCCVTHLTLTTTKISVQQQQK